MVRIYTPEEAKSLPPPTAEEVEQRVRALEAVAAARGALEPYSGVLSRAALLELLQRDDDLVASSPK